MEQLDAQTILIVAAGIAVLIVLSLARGALRRKPKKSSSMKKQSKPNQASSRRSPQNHNSANRPLADDILDMARRARIKPPRASDREVGRVAKVSPGAAIPLAWGPVEQGIERAVERTLAKSGDADLNSTADQLRFLESEGSLSGEQARLLHKMRQLRNRAAHNELEPDEVDAAAARAYGRVARALVGVLDKLR
jgi:hypothetical protein